MRVLLGLVLLVLAGSGHAAQDRGAISIAQVEEAEHAQRSRARFKTLRPKEGVEAVYAEGRLLALVRLRRIVDDDWGVKADVEFVADLASTRPISTGWDISASWEVFGFDPDEWHARYLSWTIYMDPVLVAQVKAKAKELSTLSAGQRRAALDRQIREWRLGR